MVWPTANSQSEHVFNCKARKINKLVTNLGLGCRVEHLTAPTTNMFENSGVFVSNVVTVV